MRQSAARPVVVHVLGTLNSGGPQWRVLNIIRELDSFTHVVVYQGEEKGLLYPRYVELCQVVHCPRGGGSPLSFLFRLAKVLKEIRPDAVIAHLFGNHTIVAYASRLAGVPVTFGVSTNDPVFYSKSRLWPMALAHLGRPVCTGEIAVSNAVGGQLTSKLLLPSRRVTIICNGCPVKEIASRAEAGRAAPPIPRRPGITRLIMVAMITRTKNYQTAVRALGALRRRGRQAELMIVGASSDARKRTLERVIDELDLRENVTFLGVREDVPELLGASDILVHSSNSEGFAMAVTEGMAAGLPVVASDIPACREQLDNGACGSLFPPGDADALADSIERILDDENFRAETVKAAFARVSSRYDLTHMAAGYEALLMSHLRAEQIPLSR